MTAILFCPLGTLSRCRSIHVVLHIRLYGGNCTTQHNVWSKNSLWGILVRVEGHTQFFCALKKKFNQTCFFTAWFCKLMHCSDMCQDKTHVTKRWYMKIWFDNMLKQLLNSSCAQPLPSGLQEGRLYPRSLKKREVLISSQWRYMQYIV